MPRDGRLSSQTRPSGSFVRNSQSDWALRRSLRVLTGYFSGAPSRLAAHRSLTGQIMQLGLRGRQTVAPRSITPCV